MWRVFVALVVAGGVYSAQAGVGYWYEGQEWRVSARPPLTPVWHVVALDELPRFCGGRWGQHYACAVYRIAAGECHVYATEPELAMPTWQRWHELLHCAGWDH